MSTDFNRRTFLAQASAIGMGGILPAQAAHAAASGELSVWKFGGTPNEVEQWPLKNKEFLAANPKVSLKYSFFNGQIRRQKIIAGLQTNRLPDVIIAFGQDIPEFAGFGMLRPLDAIAADRIKGWRARIVPEVMATGMHEGKLYGVPTYVDMASFLAVDMDALSEAGFKRPPATWSELRQYAKALTKPGRPGIAFPATTAPVDINIFEGIAYANGGRIFDEPKKKVTLNDPGVVAALQLYVDLIADGSTPAATSLTETFFRDTAQLFAQKRTAMWIGLSWLNTPWGTPKDLNWTGAPFPKPDTVTGTYPAVSAIMDPTAILMVSAKAANPKAAVDYIDFWTQDSQLNLWGGEPEVARIPAGKAAWNRPALEKVWPNWVSAYKNGTLFRGAQPMPRFIGVSAVESALAKAIQEAVLGRKSPKQALDDATTAAQAQIDILR